MVTRTEALNDAVTEERRGELNRERDRFDAFRQRLGLDHSAEAVTLYLTWLYRTNTQDGRRLRRHLQLLDLDRRLCGETPWIADPDVRWFLRGLHTQAPLSDGQGGPEPLYVDLVHALVDATMRLTLEQQRAKAAILTVNATGLSAYSLSRMTWNDVKFTKQAVAISAKHTCRVGHIHTDTRTVPAEAANEICPVAALRHLQAESGGVHYVFGGSGSNWDRYHVLGLLTALRATRSRGRVPLRGAALKSVIDAATQPTPSQLRDRALVLLGSGAALRSREVGLLRLGHISVNGRGINFAVPGRRRHTFVPAALGETYDPVTAWIAWQSQLEQSSRTTPDCIAFPVCRDSRIWQRPLSKAGLNYLVRKRCLEASLLGDFTWSSLRVGMIRTAIRADIRDYAIALQADLACLGSLQRHEHRENLLNRNVAGMIGL